MTIGTLSAFGLCIGLIAGVLGAGPSILTVLLLRHVGGLAIAGAITTSLVVVAVMCLVALVPYAASREVLWHSAGAFGIASMAGAFLGGRLSGWVPARVLRILFLLAVVVAAVAMLLPRPPLSESTSCTPRRRLATLSVGGVLVGMLTGLVGLGGGFAVVPLLVIFAEAPLRSAVGTSILVVGMNTLAGLAGHLPHPAVDWRVAGTLGVAESLGSLVGARVSRRIGANALRHAFGGVMLAAAAFLLARLVLG